MLAVTIHVVPYEFLEGNGDVHSYFISLYWTVGKIIEGLGHFEEVISEFFPFVAQHSAFWGRGSTGNF